MPSLFDMPLMGNGFQPGNGVLGQGNIALNDRLGGTTTGLQGTLKFFSGGSGVIYALAQQQANPQAMLVLTGAQNAPVQAPGTVGAPPPSASPINAGGSDTRGTFGNATR